MHTKGQQNVKANGA